MELAAGITKNQNRKFRKKRTADNLKICERCGECNFTKNEVYKCRSCGWINGITNVVITRGAVEP